jgi:alkanesulfonate monooxygenase SsuD/methylene tetrahydromethanopterin reductase-like flavin-dependent oxidoreductase (luciferase family)
MAMQFGVFDHLDRGEVPVHQHYENRLKIAEAYDAAGFRSYHVAEHHCTPLGMAPSPSVFLAALAQRTRRLRFGPLVYALPLYHPLRLIQEICMLDQMSRGRLEIGFGRGASPIEASYFGQDAEELQAVYAERLEVVLQGLSKDVLDFAGEYHRFENVPMELRPFQQPHPPLWYGMHSPESAERAAALGQNVVSNSTAENTRKGTDRFRALWPKHRGSAPLPCIGLVRFVVVGRSHEAALNAARQAYGTWYRSFNHLYRRYGRSPLRGGRAANFDALQAEGKGVAGTPDHVAEVLGAELAKAGANYCVGQFAFGDLTVQEVLTSIELFAAEVMPKLKAIEAPAAS